MISLTSPESHSGPAVREMRLPRAFAAVAALLREGLLAFAHNHERRH